jgi:hypothetical protein
MRNAPKALNPREARSTNYGNYGDFGNSQLPN